MENDLQFDVAPAAYPEEPIYHRDNFIHPFQAYLKGSFIRIDHLDYLMKQTSAKGMRIIEGEVEFLVEGDEEGYLVWTNITELEFPAPTVN